MGAACGCCAADEVVDVRRHAADASVLHASKRCERDEAGIRQNGIQRNEEEDRQRIMATFAAETERELRKQQKERQRQEKSVEQVKVVEQPVEQIQRVDCTPMYVYHGDFGSSEDDDVDDPMAMFGVVPLVDTADPDLLLLPVVGPHTDNSDNSLLMSADLSGTFSEKSLADLSRTSSKKSLRAAEGGGGGRTNDLLKRQPLLVLELDEVSDRDDILRDAAEVLTRMRTQCLYTSTVHTLRMVIHPVLHDAHLRFLASATEAEEIKHRYCLETDWMRAAFPVYASIAKLAVRRTEFLRDTASMEERKVKAEALRREQREAVRQADKLKWESEKKRLAAAEMSAMEMLRADLAAVREAAGQSGASAARLGRDSRAFKRKCLKLEADEDRIRTVLEVEEDSEFGEMHESCAQLEPYLVNHPNQEIYRNRKDAELAQLSVLKDRLEYRLSYESHVKAERKRMSEDEFRKGRVAALVYREGIDREEVSRNEKLSYDALVKWEGAGRDVVEAHERWRRIRGREQLRDDREDALFAESHRLVRRIGRGYLWRRRIGEVHPCREDVLRCIRKEERARKHIKQREHIAQGDLLHFAVLEARLAFPVRMESGSMLMASSTSAPVSWEVAMLFPKACPGDFPWDPSVCEPVELMFRDEIIKEFDDSFQQIIAVPASAEKIAIEGLPIHMLGARERSARKIQKKFRGYCNRKRFVETDMDEMVLAKMARLQRKTQRRLLVEVERKQRYEIVLEYEALDLDKKHTLEGWFETWRREARAATNIQRVFRGFRFRKVELDAAALEFFSAKWARIQAWMLEREQHPIAAAGTVRPDNPTGKSAVSPSQRPLPGGAAAATHAAATKTHQRNR